MLSGVISFECCFGEFLVLLGVVPAACVSGTARAEADQELPQAVPGTTLGRTQGLTTAPTKPVPGTAK